MTRYYYDSEFIDDGTTIDLISIGIVCEDGRELYLQSCDFDHRKASDWVKENVLLHLKMCPHANKYYGASQGIEGLYRADKSYHITLGGQCTFERLMPVTPPIGISIHQYFMQPIEHDVSSSYKRVISAYTDCPWRTRDQMRNEIKAFLDPEKYGKPEIYSWCGGYDFVAFCQIFGTMMDLPAGYPHYFRELQRELDLCKITDDELPQQESGLHNALEDARHIKKLWNVLFPGIGVFQL